MEQKDSKKKTTKRFHRHFETPGVPIYWIIIAYILLGWFFPVIGLLALICMIGPVLTSIFKGRWWCGHVCPRGNMYDRLLSKYSPDDYRHDHHRRRHTFVHLCPTHLVFVLSHGNHL